MLTETGFTIAELDNVPGGIGLTHWLNHDLRAVRHTISLGGAQRDARRLPRDARRRGDIVVSEEAATYRPEMQYLARLSGGALRVHDADDFTFAVRRHSARLSLFRKLRPRRTSRPRRRSWMPPPRARVRVTPPFKPFLEEKLWFALFWLRPLREFWRRELGERHFLELQKHIPYTWILDPTPLPQHAVIPGLEIHDWRELASFSAKAARSHFENQRLLRTRLGQPQRHARLRRAAQRMAGRAAAGASRTSRITRTSCSAFTKAGSSSSRSSIRPPAISRLMRGRVRLCPYYFVVGGKTRLRGALGNDRPRTKSCCTA